MSSTSLTTGSDSPVNSDSSISNPRARKTGPSTGTWSPVARAIRSSLTICSTGISTWVPSRRTLARGAVSRARRSSVFLARSSWMIPMAALETRTIPNRPSFGCWTTTKMITRRMASRMLNRVTTLALMMSAVVRLAASTTTLTWPAATRSET